MIIVYGLFIYSIYEFLKFLFLATLGDIITAIKGNYDSPERDRAIKRDLWTVAKSIIAFIIACILFQILKFILVSNLVISNHPEYNEKVSAF